MMPIAPLLQEIFDSLSLKEDMSFEVHEQTIYC